MSGSPAASVRPNFFIVGAAKAGTSALHDCFGRHPQVLMCTPKEPNHFADDLDLAYRVAELDAYLALFEGGASCTRRGESSVSYLISARAPGNIRRFEPDALILISLRNPVDALVAHHAEARRWGVEPLGDVRHALEDVIRSRGAPRRSGRPPYGVVLGYVEQVARYLDAFPAEQVRVVLYEEWVPRPDDALRPVLRWMGVDAETVPPMQRVRRPMRFRSHRVQRLVMTPPAAVRRVAATAPGLRLRSRLMRWNVDDRPRPLVDDDTRRALWEMFEPQVEDLGSLLRRDLRAVWGPGGGPPAA